jgi:hypothetical protein
MQKKMYSLFYINFVYERKKTFKGLQMHILRFMPFSLVAPLHQCSEEVDTTFRKWLAVPSSSHVYHSHQFKTIAMSQSLQYNANNRRQPCTTVNFMVVTRTFSNRLTTCMEERCFCWAHLIERVHTEQTDPLDIQILNDHPGNCGFTRGTATTQTWKYEKFM